MSKFNKVLSVIMAVTGLIVTAPMVLAGSTRADIQIAHTPPINGSLLSPEGSRLPLVIVIPGSGTSNRDGVVNGAGGIPVYRLLAEKLVKQGFAVFIYDKRWITRPELSRTFTEEDHLSDIEAIITYFRKNAAIDSARIFLFGISEGGTLAVVAASRSKSLAGVVVAAAAAIPIDELLLEQTKDDPQLNGEIRSILRAMRDNTFPKTGLMLGASRDYWLQWITFTINLPAIISKVPCRILVVHGLKDELLPGDTLRRNLQAWSTIAKANPRVTLKTYENVTHTLFERGQEEVSDCVVADICDWLTRQGKKPAIRPQT